MNSTVPPAQSSTEDLRPLGRTGLQVSRIGYGMWGMTGWSGADETRNRAVLRDAADRGITFFDSAMAYGDGASDALLGDLLAERPHLVGASKIPPANAKWPAAGSYQEAFPQEHVLRKVDELRRSLQVDTIPVLQWHVWDDAWVDDPDFRSTAELLLREKRAAHLGISLNRFQPWNGMRAITTGLIETVQVIYSIFDQNPEDELLPLCQERGVGVIARCALDEGSLSGKMTRETTFPEGDWRNRYFTPENLGATMDRVDALRDALPQDASLPETALRFAMTHPAVSTVIVGMRSSEHVLANVEAMRAGPLPLEQVETLRAHRWNR
ncbi:aldo/keto reductase [Terriglobus aquaticus]|uniref:Aldo/keto reductase n=1 Tax=Terriglobus aquaticus TaxID=940139 RepID=A0ABW9KQH2_9BACT|nr:aldo/keto reductase [Terriglobus aquaticus]